MAATAAITEVVKGHLCVQCGACVAVCPESALEMFETPAGLLRPRVDEDACSECGLCLDVCPGGGIEVPDPSPDNLFGGDVLAAYAGSACDTGVRAGGQSGGLTTALLLFALERGQIDAALVTGMPQDGSLRAVPTLARSRDEVLAAQGSKYLPSPVMQTLQDARPGERVAVVGLPCHLHALLRLKAAGSPLVAGVALTLGLVCDRVMSGLCIDLLARKAGVRPSELRSVTLRSKVRTGWPGEVHLQMKDGSDKFLPSQARISLKDYCTPARCRLCFDKLNVFADLAIGDPWGLSAPIEGDSVALARTRQAVTLVESAVEAGVLTVRKVDTEAVFAGQEIGQREKNVTGFASTWSEMGRALPTPLEAVVTRARAAGGSKDARLNRRYHDRLAFHLKVEESETRKVALATVRRSIRMDRIKAGARKVLRKVRLGR